MAARSEGIFPREGFNLDNGFFISAVQLEAPVNLANVRTFRVVITGAQFTQPTGDGEPALFAYEVGGKTYALVEADFVNGTYIAHHRGFGLDNNSTQYTIFPGAPGTGTGGTLTIGFAGIELVDGPAH